MRFAVPLILLPLVCLVCLVMAVGTAVEMAPLAADGLGMSALDAELYAVHMEDMRRADEIITRRHCPLAQGERDLREVLVARNASLAKVRASHGQ